MARGGASSLSRMRQRRLAILGRDHGKPPIHEVPLQQVAGDVVIFGNENAVVFGRHLYRI